MCVFVCLCVGGGVIVGVSFPGRDDPGKGEGGCG